MAATRCDLATDFADVLLRRRICRGCPASQAHMSRISCFAGAYVLCGVSGQGNLNRQDAKIAKRWNREWTQMDANSHEDGVSGWFRPVRSPRAAHYVRKRF